MFRKENLILTYASGVSLFNDDCFWVYINSLKNIPNADPILLTHDILPNFRYKLEDKGIEVIDVSPKDVHYIYRDRHLAFYKYINDHGHKYKHVLVTDCRDVVFQANPFDWIDQWKDRYKNINGSLTFLNNFVIGVSEGFKMSQSGFSCIEHFEFQRDIPMPFMKEDKNRFVINGGTFLGTPQAMQNFHFLVWVTTMKTIGRCTDQATINWLMNYLEEEDTYQISHPQHDNLCLTGEGVKEGAVEPIIKDGKLFNPKEMMYYMVHQWDRLDGFKEEVLANYR